jgi:hypothetical protein
LLPSVHRGLATGICKKGQLGGWPFLPKLLNKTCLLTYQTRHAFARTIFCPDLQLNACSNSGMFERTLLMRKMGSEWGLVVTTTLAICGRTCAHQE